LKAQLIEHEQQIEQAQQKEQRIQQENEKLKKQIERLKQQLEQLKAKSEKRTSNNEKTAVKNSFNFIRSMKNSKIYSFNVSSYKQSHYVTTNGVTTGGETPTKVIVRSGGKPKDWENILEIQYGCSIYENSVTFYRNVGEFYYNTVEYPEYKPGMMNKKQQEPRRVMIIRRDERNCNIDLRDFPSIKCKKRCIIYGINERIINKDKMSFFVYDVSQQLDSFTDGIQRMIYVDITELYIVSANENPVEKIIHQYKKEGKFIFEGSILKVSAFDGNTTINDQYLKQNNYYFDVYPLTRSISIQSPSEIQILSNYKKSHGESSLSEYNYVFRNEYDYPNYNNVKQDIASFVSDRMKELQRIYNT